MTNYCPNCGRSGAYDARFYQCLACVDYDLNILAREQETRDANRVKLVLEKLGSMVDPSAGMRERIAEVKWAESVARLRNIPGITRPLADYFIERAKHLGVTTVRSTQQVLDDWLDIHTAALMRGEKPDLS